ncbi:MAG TPA: UDP pyrophosphate phosphatase [Firmicutes bacterium]|nr:UDP pyrophosphate phosphatase [Bacillota bacterium]
MIEIIKYIIFGLIQGLTEPLPISSSGHLVILRYLINTDAFDDLTFEILLNFASFIAIFFLFRKDIMKLLKSFFTYIFKKDTRKNSVVKGDFKYCWLIVLGSIPAAIGGILFKDVIESHLSNPKFLGIAFLITALMLFLVRKINGSKKDKDLCVKDAIIIGLFQMIALIPGISRSGAVLVGCLLSKLDRESSLKYAFMLYLPVSIGSFILSIEDLLALDTALLVPYGIGFLVSMFVTYLASLWFFDVVKKGKLWKFSIYLIILGLFILIFV